MSDDPSEASPSDTPPSEAPFVREARLALQRAVRSDFRRTPATEAERATLAAASPAVAEPIAQDYAGWRKSMLYLASACFLLAALLSVVDYRSVEGEAAASVRESQPHLSDEQARAQVRAQFGGSNMDTLDLVPLLSLLALLAATALTVMAGRSWHQVKHSRRRARQAWYLLVGAPLLIALIPWTHLLDLDHLQPQQAEGIRMILGLTMGMQMVVLLGPKLLAILPGILRSSLTLKTLLPETGLAGWTAAVVAPFYVMLLVLVTAPLNQWHGGAVLMIGLVSLMIGGLVYLRHVRNLVRPMDGEAASALVARARGQAVLFNGLGLLLLMVFLFDLDLVTWNQALAFLTTAGGSLFLMTVVACDFLLAVMDISFHQGQALFDGAARKTLSKRLEALGTGGLTALRTAPDDAPSPASPED